MIELKTPMEMWISKLANYSSLYIFGYPVYVMYNTQERMKLDPKFRKCILFNYVDWVKGYRLWDPIDYKVTINKDVIFIEYL